MPLDVSNSEYEWKLELNIKKDEDERIKAKIKDMFKEVLDELGVATKADLEKLKEDLK